MSILSTVKQEIIRVIKLISFSAVLLVVPTMFAYVAYHHTNYPALHGGREMTLFMAWLDAFLGGCGSLIMNSLFLFGVCEYKRFSNNKPLTKLPSGFLAFLIKLAVLVTFYISVCEYLMIIKAPIITFVGGCIGGILAYALFAAVDNYDQAIHGPINNPI